MHVLDLSERSHEVAITIQPSLAAELISSICVLGCPADFPSLELGTEWLIQQRAMVPPALLELVTLSSGAPTTRFWGHLLGLVYETPEPRDVPALLARIAASSNTECVQMLLGYNQHEPQEQRQQMWMASTGDLAALDRVLQWYFPEAEQRATVQAQLFPDPQQAPDGTKRAILAVLEEWHSSYFQRQEAELAPMLEREGQLRRNLQRNLPTERFLEALTPGVEYRIGPGTREIVLVPSYYWRPWVVRLDHRDVKLIVYPISDESLAAQDDQPPQKLLKLYKALGDERRLRTLKRLTISHATLQELADHLGLAKSTMHHHLVILRAAGLVRVNMTENGDMHFSLRRDLLPDATELLRAYLG